MSARLDDVEKWLRGLGFVKESTRGSHIRWRHPATNYAVTVACHGTKLERQQLAILLRSVEQMGASDATSAQVRPKRAREGRG